MRAFLKTEKRNQREKIIDAAVDLFERKGYKATTIREIGRNAGVNPGHLYYYFEKKSQILLEVYKRAISRVLDRQKAVSGQGSNEIDTIKSFINEHLKNYLIDDRSYLAVFLREYKWLPPSDAKFAKRAAYKYRKVVEGLINQGIEKKAFENLNPTVVTFILLGMLNWTLFWFDPKGPVSLEEVMETCSAIFFDGIRKKGT